MERKIEAEEGALYVGFGSVLRARRQRAGLTLGELAVLVGCAKSHLSMLETGARAAGEELIRKIEAALGGEGVCVPGELVAAARWQATPGSVRRRVEELERTQRDAAGELRRVLIGARADEPGTALDEAWRSGRLREVVGRLAGALPAESTDLVLAHEAPSGERGLTLANALPMEVPLINSVAAGYPTEFTDLGYPARVADEYIRCPEIKDPDAFAARVVGDSMEPLYREGDIVVFSPARAVKSGMDCFVRLEPDQEATFKRVVLEKGLSGLEEEAEFIRLVPLNGEYEERVVPREMVAGLYAAVSVTRAIGEGK